MALEHEAKEIVKPKNVTSYLTKAMLAQPTLTS